MQNVSENIFELHVEYNHLLPGREIFKKKRLKTVCKDDYVAVGAAIDIFLY